MTPIQLGLLGVLALCFLASGFLSGSETAVVAIPRERILQIAESGRRGERLAALVETPEHTIGSVLVANNFVNILATAIATVLAVDLIGEPAGPVIATFLVTAIVLVAGEITPKTLAARHPEQYGLTVAPVLWWIIRILEPISKVFRAISNRILLLVGGDGHTGRAVTEADVRALALMGEQSGEIDQVEREIIDALFHVADRPVREVMTPRVDIRSLETPITMVAIRGVVSETGHSRYPVVPPGGELDEALGVLSVKDLFRIPGDATPDRVQRLLREALYVPESTPLLQVLDEIRRQRVGFALVLDEHGGVEGMVTVKDILSELVGELQDEYDPGIPAAAPLGRHRWEADGSMSVEELNEVIKQGLPEGPYTTAAGLFLFFHGDIPVEGEAVKVANVRLTVVQMDRNRIARLRVELVPDG